MSTPDSHWHIEAIIRGMRQRLHMGWTLANTLADLRHLGADPNDLYLCLKAVTILESDRGNRIRA